MPSAVPVQRYVQGCASCGGGVARDVRWVQVNAAGAMQCDWAGLKNWCDGDMLPGMSIVVA